jgi:hypothetical protein
MIIHCEFMMPERETGLSGILFLSSLLPAHAMNNPARYTDPSGHRARGDGEIVNCSGHLYTPSKGERGCGHDNNPCLGQPSTEEGRLKELIQQEIDRRFDPYIGFFPPNFHYADSEFPQLDFLTEQAYEQAGYNLIELGSQNMDNPMRDDDWQKAGVPIDYIYSKGIWAKAPGHQFFLQYMGRDINNPSNFEANYINALMSTHPLQLYRAKTAYYDQLLSEHGSLSGAWEYLQMSIDVAGPAD